MKNVLVIGSTVVDIIINVDHLPRTQEDVHVLNQHMALGGCAYNASDILRHFKVPYILFSPVGTGAYGDFVRAQLSSRGVSTPIPSPSRDNGCCYCFVEANGERTFISYHGAEYLFERDWFQIPDAETIDAVYLCGLEIEEPTGPNIIEYLEAHPEYRIYFAPGPRISHIDPSLLDRLFALHPVLHLNEEEVFTCAQLAPGASALAAGTLTAEKAAAGGTSNRLESAAEVVFHMTKNDVIVTLGEKGAYYHTADDAGYVPGFRATQVDTIGAGDSHIGAVIACEKRGASLPDAIRTANLVAAKVVETPGALLSEEQFRELPLTCV